MTLIGISRRKGFQAALAFKALAKAGSGQMIDKAGNNAAGDIDPAARPKCQGQISADRAQQATEHIERGPAALQPPSRAALVIEAASRPGTPAPSTAASAW